MALNWRPVGPEPESTYWVRRGVALAAVVAVLALLSAAFGGSDPAPTRAAGVEAAASEPTPSATPTAEPSADPSANPSADPSADPTADPAVAVCADDALEVAVASDARSYASGAKPELTLTVRNASAEPCRRALGQAAAEIVVTSGSDRIWSSDDCAPGGPQGEIVLQPGATETSRVTWPAVRSAPGCPKDQPAAQPGTYTLSGRVGDLQVDGASFTVTG